jgi:hypothetical protein
MENTAINNTNNNCRFCLRIFEDMEERVGITSQISDEFRNITQTEVRKAESKQKPKIAFGGGLLCFGLASMVLEE